MYVQQFVRELEAFYEQMDREWYSDDPEWQKSHQNADSARKEQRAAKDYREKQEKAQRARDLSTQAAINEKFAVRDYLASQPGKEYTEAEKETKKFWERFLNSDNFYSPYDDLLSSIQAKKEREQRAKIAEESSTQAALDEKLAIRRYAEDLKNTSWGKNRKIEEAARNYSDGSSAFDKEGHINGQGHTSIGSMKFGNSDVATSGCGAIAVYNVLQDMGKTQISLSDVIRTAERNGYMLAGGKLGIMSGNISRLMNDFGVDHVEVSPHDLQADAIDGKIQDGQMFVVTAWNDKGNFLHGMHNYEMVYKKDNTENPWTVYNYYSNSYRTWEFQTVDSVLDGGKFISIFQVEVGR